jgi:hypothetical protein
MLDADRDGDVGETGDAGDGGADTFHAEDCLKEPAGSVFLSATGVDGVESDIL